MNVTRHPHYIKKKLMREIAASGLILQEELRMERAVRLKVRTDSTSKYLTLFIHIDGKNDGDTMINTDFKINWLRYCVQTFIFIATVFMLSLFTGLLLRESWIEGGVLLAVSVFVCVGVYIKLLHFSSSKIQQVLSAVRQLN